MRDRFTRVLKGHIALARAVFPEGTRGTQLDSSRGSICGRRASITPTAPATASAAYLAVHEGPQRISPAGRPGRRRRAAPPA